MVDRNVPITWSNAFDTGIELIDGEHKMIFSALKDVHLAVENDLGERLISRVILVLCNFVKSHFKNEERFMLEIGYSDLENHQNDHQRYIEKLDGVRDMFSKGQSVLQPLSEIFSEYLNAHVLIEDAKIGDFAKANPSHKYW